MLSYSIKVIGSRNLKNKYVKNVPISYRSNYKWYGKNDEFEAILGKNHGI